MKKLIAFVSFVFFVVVTAMAESNTSMYTTMNLKLTLTANGALDAAPIWVSVGPGDLQVAPDGMSALYVSGPAGTNTVTVSASSQGNVLTQKITIKITQPPATVLALSATLVAK